MRKLFLLELFSGSKSVSTAVRRKFGRDYDVRALSVDIDPAFKPDVVADVNTWRFRPDIDLFLSPKRSGDVVVVWLSPPCTHFSFARTTGGPRDLRGAARTVKSGLNIVRYCRPNFFFMENPVGLLAKQRWIQRFNRTYLNTCSYCKYSSRGYRKNTNIWSNVPSLDLHVCNSESPCALKRHYGFHPVTAQSGITGRSEGSGAGKNVYGIPNRLVSALFSAGLKFCARRSDRCGDASAQL